MAQDSSLACEISGRTGSETCLNQRAAGLKHRPPPRFILRVDWQVLTAGHRLYYTVFIGIRLINLSINKSIRRILIISANPVFYVVEQKTLAAEL